MTGWLRSHARLLPLLGIFFLVGSCAQEVSRPGAPAGGAALRLDVAFRKEAPPLPADPAGPARIEEVRAEAFEVLPSEAESLRASTTASIGPSDQTFEIELDVPPADLYRVVVDASGTRVTDEVESERGILFIGEGFASDVRSDEPDTVSIELLPIVPRLSAEVLRTSYRLAWTPVEGALRFRIKETPDVGEERESTTTRLDSTLSLFQPGRDPAAQSLRYRVRAELSRGIVSAFSEAIEISLPNRVPPDPILDLTVVESTFASARLAWTATGSDGSVGQASAYDLRFATEPITETSFEGATPVSGVPAPQPTGQNETFRVLDLVPETTYFFAIQVLDEVPNRSALSNVASVRTPPAPDVTPPGAIADLAVTSTGIADVTLSWTAPGDDAFVGIAASYDVRFALKPITEETFDAASAVAGEPLPAPAGGHESFTVSGLEPETTYFFAVRTSDEVPNVSGLSNVAAATTLPPPDTTPPSPVTDLTVLTTTDRSVTLLWTAPGDDGAVGQASLYDLRVATSPITEGNFESTPQASGEPAPQPAGESEVFTVGGLEPSTTYYFALKTHDEVPNVSGLSNLRSATTLPPPDTTPPGSVTDLAVTTVTEGSVSLAWTAPGDDGDLGQASLYDLRIATTPIDEGNFDVASPVIGEPAPQTAGGNEAVTVGGLAPATAYYFALKTEDEVPNVSGISNVVPATTLPLADTVPPTAVPNLRVTETTATTATLAWTATGDDGRTGIASLYDLRYATFPITVENLSDASQVSGEPPPQEAGSAESFTIEGLEPETTYYFGLLVADEVPNWSDLSNVPFTRTLALPDTTPPGPVTDLAVQATTSSSITFYWTAPGDDGTTGQAASYDLRYATFFFDETSWNLLTQATGEPAPGPAGTLETFTVPGLNDSTTYYFALKTADEIPNVSLLSNVTPGTTDGAPSPLASFVVTPGDQQNTLRWRLPDDPAARGVRIRYSLTDYPGDPFAGLSVPNGSDGNFAGAPGDSSSFVHLNLENGATVYYSAFVYDETPLYSEGSTTAATPSLDANWWPGFAPPPDGWGLNGEVDALIEYNGVLVAGGLFTDAGGTPANNIAYWDGGKWFPLFSGTNGRVTSFTIFPLVGGPSLLIVGGEFTLVGGVETGYVAAWDGQEWQALAGNELTGPVYALTTWSDPDGIEMIVAGGAFPGNVAAWYYEGWFQLGSEGLDAPVYALGHFYDELIAGGEFQNADGLPEARFIAGWFGSSWFNLGDGLDGAVHSLTFANGCLIAGGDFNASGSVPLGGLACWDGGGWSSYGLDFNSTVNAITIYNGDLVAGGVFDFSSGGSDFHHLARRSGAEWIPLGSGTSAPVWALAPFQGSLFAGGPFHEAGAKPSWNIGRWSDLGGRSTPPSARGRPGRSP